MELTPKSVTAVILSLMAAFVITITLTTPDLKTYKEPPFIKDDRATDDCILNFATVSEHRLDNQSKIADLQARLGGMKNTTIVEAEGPDKGATVAYYNGKGEFWVVQHGTIAGDQYFGPFMRNPIECTFRSFP